MSEGVHIREELHFGDRVLRCFADRPASLEAKLAASFAVSADREALVDAQRRLTYRALDERIDAAAGLFWHKGLRAGDRVGVVVPNRAEFVIAILAAQRIGAIPVPINVRESAHEIAFILADCEAAGLVFDPSQDSAADAAAALADGVWGLAIDDLWNAESGEGYLRPERRDPDETVCILYTSGTTGKPKGALLCDLNILHSILHYEHHLGLGSPDVALLVVPATHITGLIGLIMAPLGAGAKVVMMEGFNTSALVTTAAREGMTYTIMV